MGRSLPTHLQRNKRKKSRPLKQNKIRDIPLIGFIAVHLFKRLLELLGKEWILFYHRNGQSTQKLIDKLTQVIVKLSPYDYTLPDGILSLESMTPKQQSLQKLAFVVSHERYVAYDPSLGMFSTDMENISRIFMGAYDIYVVYDTVSCFSFIGQAPTPLEIPDEIPPETPLVIPEETPLVIPEENPLEIPSELRKLLPNIRWENWV